MKENEEQHRSALYELVNYDGLYGISKKVQDEADAIEKLREIAGEFPEYKPPSQRK